MTVGGAICGAYNDAAFSGPRIGLWVPEDCPLPTKRQVPPGSDQSVIGSYWSEVGLDYFTGHLTDLPPVVAARLGRVLGVYAPGQTNDEAVREGVPEKVAWAAYASFFVFAAFGVYGAVVLRRRRVPIYPLLGAIAVVIAATGGFYGLFRYRLTLDLVLVILTGVAVDALWSGFVARRPGSPGRHAAPTPLGTDAEHHEDVEGSPAAPPA